MIRRPPGSTSTDTPFPYTTLFRSPAQLVGDFIRNTPSTVLGSVEPSYKPGVKLGDLSPSLPEYAIEAIREALPAFEKQIKGFAQHDAVLTGVETRSEERRVGKECVSTCRSRWAPSHSKNKKQQD